MDKGSFKLFSFFSSQSDFVESISRTLNMINPFYKN
jgi:hypothetical protein